MSARLVLPVRDLFGAAPRAARWFSSEQVAGLLWILRYIPDEEHSRPRALRRWRTPSMSSTWRGG
jgi:hypothetical protein